MAGDDVTITIRADNGQAIRAFRDVNGNLRDMRGRFVSEGSAMSGAMNGLASSIGGVRGALIPLATAAVPLGAALAPVAAKSAAAGLAVAAFGIAVAGQVSALSEASEAQQKYTDAVAKSGHGSKQAAEAQLAVSASLASMPKATQLAAVGLQTLKGDFQDWSDSVAKFTMAPVEKSFTVLGQILPKLTPMVKGTSEQFDRLVTVAGGAIATPGFDALSQKVSAFANRAVKDAVDGVIHFSRALSEGQVSGPIKAFMEYAEKNGPALRETLSAVGDAVSTLATAAADAGPGMLTLVTAAAQMVAALPPELVATVMQLAVGLKLVTLAGAGITAVSAGVAALGARIVALRAASTAAGGGLAGLGAAFATLGKAAKASIVVAGIAAVALAFKELSEIGEEAPPNVEKLSTSLTELGRTGKLSGEAARVLGADFSKLHDVVSKVADPSISESINNWGADITNGFLNAGESTEELIEKMDGVDDALSTMVKNGNADLAKAAIERMTKGMDAAELKEFKQEIDGYDAALADAKLEAELVADSMGIFGQAAADTSAKLEAQKQSADGLRASILALNDVNRSAYDSQIQFEESIDKLTESFKEHGATLNLDTDAGRQNAQAMSQAAKAHDEMLAAGVASDEAMGSMTKKSDELRASMMKLAVDAFDGNKKKAQEYVNTLLGVPSELITLVKAEKDDALTGLRAVQEEIRKTPGAKEVVVETLNSAALAALEAVGLKTERLPDGRTRVTTANGQSIGAIEAVSLAMNRLDGKTARTYTKHFITTIREIRTHYSTTGRGIKELQYAHGGAVGYAAGGSVQRFPTGGSVTGPGTETSDSIPALLSNGEFVVNAQQTRRFRPLLEAVNSGRMGAATRSVMRQSSTGAAASWAGAGAAQPFVIQLDLDGERVVEVLFDPLRKKISNLGGSVQGALGRGRG